MIEVSRTLLPIPGDEEVELAFRRNASGLSVKVRSKIFESFFKGLKREGIDETVKAKDWALSLYNLKSTPIISGMCLNSLEQFGRGGEILLEGPIVNGTFLRAVGLTEGIEFKVPGLFSKTYMENCRRGFEKAIQDFAIEYLAPYEVGVVVRSYKKESLDGGAY